MYFLEQEIGNLSFDKDDQLAVELVTAAANIRAASFGIPLQNLFEAKGIAGNIVHAVATTNAIIAGLIVIEAIKVLRGDVKSYRYDGIRIPLPAHSIFYIGCIDREVIFYILFGFENYKFITNDALRNTIPLNN